MGKVLLVENEPEHYTVIAKQLKEHTHTVDLAISVDQAGNQLSQETEYDVVIVDLFIFEHSGVETATAGWGVLSDALRRYPRIRRVAISKKEDPVSVKNGCIFPKSTG